ADGTLTFSLPTPTAQNFPIDYNVWGTATNGIDFQTIPAGLFIPAGQTEVSIPLIAFTDNLADNGEFIAIDVQRDPCHRDTIYIKLLDNGILPPSLRQDTTVCQSNLIPLDVNGTLPITLPPPPSFSNTQDYNIAPVGTFITSPVTVSGLIQKKIEPGVIRSICLNIDHPFDDDLDIFLFSPAGQFVELSTDNGANGKNYTNTCFLLDAAQVVSFPGPQAPVTAAPFTGSFLPEGPWTDLYGDRPTNGTWQLQVRDDANGFTGTLRDWTITFEPAYKLNYQWSPVDSVACPSCAVTTINPSQTTIYTLTATDSYGCVVKDSVKIDVLPALAAPVISCGNSSTNSVSFDWGNVPGAMGYQVNINGGGWTPASDSLSHTILGLLPNTVVNIQVQAIGGLPDCTPFISSATCVNCQSPTASLAVTGVSCAGSVDGSVLVTPDGANPPYSFQLDAQTNTTGNFQNLAPGNYLVTVTDPTGCEGYFQFDVSTPTAILPAIAVQQNVSCFGGNNAIIMTEATGGTGALGYLWDDPAGQTTATATNLAAGSYVVTVTDASGCTAIDTATVTQPTDLSASTVVTNAKCFSQPSGSILAAALGGTFPYEYAWTSGPPTELNDNLLAGTYTVTVTDANGCTETTVATVGQPTQLTTTATTIAAQCNASADGSATVSPQGGTGPYTFLWNDSQQQTTATANGLISQSYNVTVTDVNGCAANQSASVAAPPPLSLNLTQTNSSCNSLADGTAAIVANGGTAPYTYQWDDPAGQSTATAIGLAAGNYAVTVTDAHSCTDQGSTTIGEPAAMQATATPVDAVCFGSATGKVNLSLQGGTAPFTFAWSSGDLSPNITAKTAGSYTATVTDANGCTTVATATVGEATEIQWTSSEKSILCKNGNDGGISLTATGGQPGYTLTWAGPNGFSGSGMNLQNLFAGNYTATLTDAAGCTQVVNQAVTEPPTGLALSLAPLADTICFGASNGQARVVATGGTQPYTYQWDAGGQTTATAFGLSSQPYNVTVTDQNNCTQTAQTFVIQKQELSVFAAADKPLCYNGSDGKAHVTVIFYGIENADFNDFSYLWSTTPIQTNLEATGLLANTDYTVTVVDAQGCTAERS
ncbi:MAG: proprotein convertase P-domain-containing protein, partial [Saprospiraceae bacterium]